MKDLEVLSDPKTIKTLFEPTRATIIFRYLVKGAMTVKQLADALGKNPGTILHHIDKLKSVGLIDQVGTEQTPTGIVQRYYQASAREYRFGIAEMMRSDKGLAQFAKTRLESMVKGLAAYGIYISEEQQANAVELLKKLIERENQVLSNLAIDNKELYAQLPTPVRTDAARIIRRLALDDDKEYSRIREEWHNFLRASQHNKLE